MQYFLIDYLIIKKNSDKPYSSFRGSKLEHKCAAYTVACKYGM
jgi:hypothetical protein